MQSSPTAENQLLRRRFRPVRHIPMEGRLEFAFWRKERVVVLLRRKLVSQILLRFSEIELVDQEKLVPTALLEFSNQKGVQSTRGRIPQKRALPPSLLVDYEIQVVEVVFGCSRFFSSLFRKDSVKFCVNDQFLPGVNSVEQHLA